MKKIIAVVLFFFSFHFFAQENSLKFDKKFFECENQWVALKMNDNEPTYMLGVIYFDPYKGYVFNTMNDFKIDESNIFKPTQEQISTSIINVISNVNLRFSIIPEAKYKELNIDKLNEVFNTIRYDENNADDLVKKGYHLNHVGASEVAIPILEKAEKINPKANGLLFELGYAYNATKQYKKTITLLHIGISKFERNNWLLYKELIFALVFEKQLDNAEETFKNGLKSVKNKTNVAESSYNIAYGYFTEKNKKKFEEWFSITSQHSNNESEYIKNLELMKKELNK